MELFLLPLFIAICKSQDDVYGPVYTGEGHTPIDISVPVGSTGDGGDETPDDYYESWDQVTSEGLVSTTGSIVGTANYVYSSDLARRSFTLYSSRQSELLYDPQTESTWFSSTFFTGSRTKCKLSYECENVGTCSIAGNIVLDSGAVYLDILPDLRVRFHLGASNLDLNSLYYTDTTHFNSTPTMRQGVSLPTSYGFRWVNVRILVVPDGSTPYYRECDVLGFSLRRGRAGQNKRFSTQRICQGHAFDIQK